MQIDVIHSMAIIAVVALVTALIRFSPFIIFPAGKEAPKTINYLGTVLPYAIMGMLVIYCLRNTSFASAGQWAPAFISVALVVALHVWKRNTLISVLCGTICYMVLVQTVFA